MDDLDRRLWELESRVRGIDDFELAARLVAVEQQLWQRWQRSRAAAAPTPTTMTLALTVLGGYGNVLPGARCYLTASNGSGAGVDLSGNAGDAVTDSLGQATYVLQFGDSSPITSGSLQVDKPPGVGGLVYDAVTDLGLAMGSNSFTADVAGSITTGYLAVPTQGDPVKDVALVDDPLYGTIGVGWDSGSLWRSGVISLDFAGGAGCAAIANVQCEYFLDFGNNRVRVRYRTQGAGLDCPGNTATTADSDAPFVAKSSLIWSASPNWGQSFSTPSGSKWWPTTQTLSAYSF